MKKYHKRLKYFLIVCFSFFISSVSSAQSLQQTYDFASTQYNIGNYPAAIKGFIRVLFFDNNNFSAKTYLQLANCYYETQQFEKAIVYYDLSFNSFQEDSLKNEIFFKKVSTLINMMNFKYALIELLSIDEINLSLFFKNKRDFYLGVTYFNLYQFELAEKHFINTLSVNDSLEITKLQLSFTKNNKINCLNPKTAKYLSMFIPGLGQFYCGDFKNGINSLLLTSGFAILFISTSINYTFIDAAVSVLPWYQRYYTGGVKKAELIAEKKIQYKRSLIYEDIVNTIYSAKNK